MTALITKEPIAHRGSLVDKIGPRQGEMAQGRVGTQQSMRADDDMHISWNSSFA